MSDARNKYTTLISNTIIFALGTFGSKLLVFLLMPLYTSVLTTAEYGAMDVVVNVSNMLLPLVIVSINDGVIRFGMDHAYKRRDVFSTGIWVSLAGFGIFLIFWPVMKKIDMISDYTALIYIYVLAAALQGVSVQFVRAMGLVRLFAFNGILNTLSTVFFNVLFLVVMNGVCTDISSRLSSPMWYPWSFCGSPPGSTAICAGGRASAGKQSGR